MEALDNSEEKLIVNGTVIMIDPNKPIHDAETELNKNYKNG